MRNARLHLSPTAGWLGLLMGLALLVPASHAHDTGFGHSRRTLLISATPTGYVFEYRIELHQDEALLEYIHVDANHDGQVSPEEQKAYYDARGKQLIAGFRWTTDTGAPLAVPLTMTLTSWELGQALTQIYRYQITTTAIALTLDDQNFTYKHGTTLVFPGDGVKVVTPEDLFHASRVVVQIFRVPAPLAPTTAYAK